MPLISDTIPQFFNGVSQQAPNLRRKDQLEDQVNCWSSISDGVIPRPPTNHLAKISASSLGNVAVHTINRDVDNRFKVIIKNGSIQVFDIDGTEMTVTYPAGTGYLTSTDPKSDFEAFTIKDFTFILNKSVTTAKELKAAVSLPSGFSTSTQYFVRKVSADMFTLHPTLADAVNDTNVVDFSTQGNGVITFSNYPDPSISPRSVGVGGGDDQFSTSTSGMTHGDGPFTVNGSGSYWINLISTDNISLHTSVSDALSDTSRVYQASTFTLAYVGDDGLFGDEVIANSDFDFINDDITLTGHPYETGYSIEMSVADSAVDGVIQKFSVLKDVVGSDAAGSVYKIEGTDDTAFDSYYVEKTINRGTSEGDVYEEVVDPSVTANEFDDSTMPHQLVKTGATTFELQVIPWVARAAGDETTNPFPSFTGNTISDIFLFRDRFGFLSGDNVILSESGGDNYFNFFRTTVTQLLDSAPIDVSATNTKVSDLKFAVPFDKDLLLFSEQTQFVLGSDDLLTPETTEINTTTQFTASTKARPEAAGRNVYFPVEKSNFSSIREYFADNNNDTNDAADVTKHVPRYLPKNIFKLVASSNDDVLFCLSEDAQDTLFVYQWYWAQQNGGLNKAQSAFHKWVFTGATVVNVDIIDNTLYLVLERGGETFLESIDLTTRNLETGLNYQVRLDRKTDVTGVYDAGTDKTTWTVPYDISAGTPVVVRDSGFSTNKGLQVLGASSPTSTTIEVLGDLSTSPCFIGIEYDKYFTLSPLFVRKSSPNGGSIARLGGRLQVRKMKFSYSDTSFFEVDVTPQSRSTYTRTFTPPIGSSSSAIGISTPTDGVFSVPVGSRGDTTTITIKSSSYLPFAITSAEVEGFYHTNAR